MNNLSQFIRGLAAVIAFLALQPAFAQNGGERLPAGPGISDTTFADPPAGSGIRCWWWWLNGNVTKVSITRDL
ncbi:MAG TPA: hypothetical protein VD772_06025, partial [Anseongella sp.]|nr:hypothetical protein [Anseongella sp.]